SPRRAGLRERVGVCRPPPASPPPPPCLAAPLRVREPASRQCLPSSWRSQLSQEQSFRPRQAARAPECGLPAAVPSTLSAQLPSNPFAQVPPEPVSPHLAPLRSRHRCCLSSIQRCSPKSTSWFPPAAPHWKPQYPPPAHQTQPVAVPPPALRTNLYMRSLAKAHFHFSNYKSPSETPHLLNFSRMTRTT